MVIANQKSTIDPHTKKKKEFKHNTKDSHQITREKNKRKGRKKGGEFASRWGSKESLLLRK